MSKFSRDTEVLVGSRNLKIEEILQSIIYYPADKVLEFFNGIGLTVPRELRIFVLRENLREKVAETKKTRLTLADELNYRLSWFTEFTETQLENLLVFFDDQVIFKKYLEDLWTDLFGYMVEKKVPNFDLDDLYQKSLAYVKSNDLVLPQINNYNNIIKGIFFDSFGRIDGVSPNKIRNVLYKSSTLTEIRDLGKKYEVDIPRRLKKTQLADIIIEELRDNGSYTEDLEKQVRSMSVIVMQRFAIDRDIKASTELKKEEVIEYILKNAKETKETYFIPNSREVYEKELTDELEDNDVVETPIIEEKEEVVEKVQPEEIVEEADAAEEIIEEQPALEEDVDEVNTVVEEESSEPSVQAVVKTENENPKVQYVQHYMDIEPLVTEVKKLREAVENFELKTDEPKKELSVFENVPEEKIAVKDDKIEFINSAEYYGDRKSYSKLVKNDEAKEREVFVEQQKQTELGTAKENNEDSDVPIEVRAIAKFFKFIGLVLWKILRFFLKFAFILAIIAIVLILLYALLDYFVQFSFLDSFTATLNNIKIGGKGIIERLFLFFDYLGMTQNTQ